MTPRRGGACLLLVIALVAPGCITFDGPATLDVRILVTSDLGTIVLREEAITVPEGASALDALQAVATVATSHGGGFVQAIDGRASRYPDARVDWFYHVNGALQDSGSADRTLADGDVVLWDHRPWNRTLVQPLVLTGTQLRPAPDALASPRPSGALETVSEDQRFLRVHGETLILLDAWGVATARIEPPWIAVHATTGGGFIVAASSEAATPLATNLHRWTPTGVGVVATPHGLLEVPG